MICHPLIIYSWPDYVIIDYCWSHMIRYIPVLQYQDLNSLNWSWAKYRLSDPNEGFFYKQAKAYHYASPESRKTWRWIRVGESKNVTPMSRATPISNALADSTCGGYRPWVSCRWYGTIIWAHMYPYVIHLIVLRYVYHANGFTQLTPCTPVGEPLKTLLFNPPLFARLSFPWTEISPKHNQGVIWAQNKCHFWTQHLWKPQYRHFV